MTNNFFYLKYDISSALKHFETKWIHSILSLFGIIISISSIIVMISISDGAKQKMLENIRDLGINTIRIINKPFSEISNLNTNLTNGLNEQDNRLIKSIISKYGYSTTVNKLKNQSIYFNNADTTSTVIATDEKFHLIEQLKILKGRPIFKNDITDYSTVAIISEDLANRYHASIGDKVTFNNNLFEIIGIASNKSSLNNFILIPQGTYSHKDNETFDEINLFIKEKNQILLIANILNDRILTNHNNIENFIINTPLEIIKKEESAQNTFNAVLLTIALMSLMSGGISVMNAVLSNINEQTREIGLKLSLGATQFRIIRFYLLYTTLLTIIGGILGGFIGYIILYLLTLFTNLYILFSLKALVLGIFISISSGIIFGIYPAIRASRIEPIIALKEF